MYLPVNKRFSRQKQPHGIVRLSFLRYIWATNFSNEHLRYEKNRYRVKPVSPIRFLYKEGQYL